MKAEKLFTFAEFVKETGVKPWALVNMMRERNQAIKPVRGGGQGVKAYFSASQVQAMKLFLWAQSDMKACKKKLRSAHKS